MSIKKGIKMSVSVYTSTNEKQCFDFFLRSNLSNTVFIEAVNEYVEVEGR